MLQLERERRTELTRWGQRPADAPAVEMCSREPQSLAALMPDVLERYLNAPRMPGEPSPRVRS